MTFKQLDIPGYIKRSKSIAYWIIQVLNYIEEEKKMFCKIVSYNTGETNFENKQILLSDRLNDLECIIFNDINTDGLLGSLTKIGPCHYTPSRNTPVIRQQFCFPSRHVEREPIKQTINETFFVPLKNVRFKHGGVSFEKKFKGYDKNIELTIDNEDIREEFEAVKNYFANVLNTKKIEVAVNIEITDDEITFKDIRSPEIDKIDKHLIDNVRCGFVNSIIKKNTSDKNLYTIKEYFESTNEKIKADTFYNNDKELLEDLLTISNTQHHRQLRFLSSKHAYNIMKLRFGLKPFSFIFLIEGERNYHFIWETLDTKEATYIWHFAKERKLLKSNFQKIEENISLIKAQGKTDYLSSTEDPIERIYHDYSEPIDGFVKWKGELESKLT
jgi:hypothetical protein